MRALRFTLDLNSVELEELYEKIKGKLHVVPQRGHILRDSTANPHRMHTHIHTRAGTEKAVGLTEHPGEPHASYRPPDKGVGD